MNLSDDDSSDEECMEQMLNRALSNPRSEESDHASDEIVDGRFQSSPTAVGRNLSFESYDVDDDLEDRLNQALSKPDVEDVKYDTILPAELNSTLTDQDTEALKTTRSFTAESSDEDDDLELEHFLDQALSKPKENNTVILEKPNSTLIDQDLSDEEGLENFLNQALSKNPKEPSSLKPAQANSRVRKRKSIRDLCTSKAKKRKVGILNGTGVAPQSISTSDDRKPPVKKKTAADSIHCPICNLRIRTLRIGELDGCNHTFCLKCIPKNTDRCPVDKLRFNNVIVKDRVSGNIVKTTKARYNKRSVDCVCELCGSSENNPIPCDGCNRKYHIQCLPSIECVSVIDWLCISCEKSGNTSQISNALKKSNSFERSIALQRTIRNISKKEVPVPKLGNKDLCKKEKPNLAKVSDAPASTDLLGEILKKQEELYGFALKKSSEDDESPSPPNSLSSVEPNANKNNSTVNNMKNPSSKIFFNTNDKRAKISIIEQVAEEALKPHFLRGAVNKDQYKYIMGKVVPKVLNFGNNSVDPGAVAKLVKDYMITLKK